MPNKNSEIPKKLLLPNGSRLAYHYTPGKTPGVIFLGGFNSNMTGTKAKYIELDCKKNNRSFLRFDYFGHGQSDGKFEDGTLGKWIENTIFVLDELTEGNQVLVGSSMGGWIMFLVALKRIERISGLVGIAPAPDFTFDILNRLSLEQKKSLKLNGYFIYESSYDSEPMQINLNFIEESKRNYILNKKINIDIPIRLVHGLKDQDVDWKKSLKLSNIVNNKNIAINFIPDGAHRLSRNKDLEIITKIINKLCKE